jgi:F0F1-type ATP synthase membrane subunit b/b'
MIILSTLLINANGLFDFDLTFFIEALLFLLFAIFINFFFLQPISNILEKRDYSINYALKKSKILIVYGFENLYQSVKNFLIQSEELERQNKLLINQINESFDNEFLLISREVQQFLLKMKFQFLINSLKKYKLLQIDLLNFSNKYFEYIINQKVS